MLASVVVDAEGNSLEGTAMVPGEAVTAVVVPVGADPPSGRELLDFCRERLAGFETPKRVIFTDSLPETVGGKVLKYKLRQQYR